MPSSSSPGAAITGNPALENAVWLSPEAIEPNPLLERKARLFRFSSDWSGKCSLYIPPCRQAALKRTVFDLHILRPSREALGFTLEGKSSVRVLIAVLLFCRRPSAIFRAVVTVIVNSIQGHSVRRFAHVVKEIFKTAPSLTNTNAPATVSWIIVVRRISTSLDHGSPPRVGRRPAHTVFGLK
jgi:hypothetical protein